MSQPHDRRVARYAADIAEALVGLESLDLDYGQFYISGIEISFDGDPCGVHIIPDDHGTLAVQLD